MAVVAYSEKKVDLSLGFDVDEDCVIGFQLYSLLLLTHTQPYISICFGLYFQESKRAWVIPSKVEPLYTCWWTDGHVPGMIFFIQIEINTFYNLDI